MRRLAEVLRATNGPWMRRHRWRPWQRRRWRVWWRRQRGPDEDVRHRLVDADRDDVVVAVAALAATTMYIIAPAAVAIVIRPLVADVVAIGLREVAIALVRI